MCLCVCWCKVKHQTSPKAALIMNNVSLFDQHQLPHNIHLSHPICINLKEAFIYSLTQSCPLPAARSCVCVL